MSLVNLCLAAASERGRGRLFQWMLAVSSALGTSGSGGVYPQYASGKGVAVQNNVGAATTLNFEVDGILNGITKQGGDSWILTAGKVYMLRASGFFDTFSDTTGGQVSVQWVDGNNNVLVTGSIDSPTSIFAPGTNTTARSTAGVVEFLYLCPATDVQRIVRVRTTGATGTCRQPGSAWSVNIIEVPVAA